MICCGTAQVWMYFCKKDDLKFFKTWLCSLKFGIESGSQRMLDIMEKRFTVEDVEKHCLVVMILIYILPSRFYGRNAR